jgi:MFS family permease
MTVSTPTTELERRCAANIHRFYLYRFLSNLQLWLPIWVYFLQRDRGLSLAQIGLLEVPLQIVSILSAMPGGALADRWGRKLALLLGGVSFAVAVFVFGAGPNLWWLLLSQVIFGVAFTLSLGPANAFLNDSLAAIGRSGEFSRVIGRGQACMLGAFLIGGLAGAPLAAITNLEFPILLSAGIALVSALVVFGFHEPPRQEQRESMPYLQIMRESARYALRHPRLRAMIALNALLLALGFPGQIYLQPFLTQHHVGLSLFGLIATPIGLASVAGSLVAARAVGRFGERRAFCAVAAILTGSLLLLGLVPSLAALVAFLGMNLAFAAAQPLAGEYINRHSPDELRATVASVAWMAQSVLFAVSAPLLGLLTDHTSIETMFLVSGLAGGLLVAMALLVWVRADQIGAGSTRSEMVSAPGK